jgi:hypothetical protein
MRFVCPDDIGQLVVLQEVVDSLSSETEREKIIRAFRSVKREEK